MSEPTSLALPGDDDGRRGLQQLKGAERAELAHELFKGYVKGASYKSLCERYNVTHNACKTLISEYAHIVQEHRPSARLAGEEQYRMLIEFAWKALDEGMQKDYEEGGLNLRSQNTTKYLELILQSQTRLDKYYGLESPELHIVDNARSIADLVREADRENSARGHVPIDDVITMEEYLESSPEDAED